MGHSDHQRSATECLRIPRNRRLAPEAWVGSSVCDWCHLIGVSRSIEQHGATCTNEMPPDFDVHEHWQGA